MKKNTPKILIVDDDENILRLLGVIVENCGFLHVSADCAEKAMAQIRNNKFNLVLLDIALPDMSGMTILEYIKKFSPDTPVIMITGYDNEEVATYCLANGAQDYISKPFDPDYLQTSINANIV